MTGGSVTRDGRDPLGVYVHVPFCRVHCPYCDFYTYPASRGREEEYGRALVREITLVERRLRPERFLVETIYFGGGTPSTLAPARIREVIARLGERLSISREAEITLEANPEDVSAEMLEVWKEAGPNRISIGVQTLAPESLAFLGRMHSSAAARRSLDLLSTHPNWSADLMFGWEGQTVEQLEADLKAVLSCAPPHISLYQLTLEPKTRLGVLAARNLVRCADTDCQADLYLAACEILESAGLRQYEVSNFARPGFESRHNQAYWERRPYLGLGPSAASLINQRRTRNIASLPRYIAALNAGGWPLASVEVLTPDQVATERLWLGLRTAAGVELSSIPAGCEAMLAEARRQGFLLTGQSNRIILSRKGMAVADELVQRLLPTVQRSNLECES